MFYEDALDEPETPFRHRDYKGTNHHWKMQGAEFIAWDGEGTKVEPQPIEIETGKGSFFYWPDTKNIFDEHGKLITCKREPQPYVLLAWGGKDKGGHIKRQEGLHTIECLELILNTKKEYPNSIFVGFGFNYDINQILADLPDICLRNLHQNNQTHYGSYYLRWYPSKYFIVSHKRTKRSAIIYDTLGFFQTKFLTVCEQYLGAEDLTLIERGKERREVFEWEQLDDFILPYCRMELDMLVRIMDKLRTDLAAVDVHPSKWYGPGAVADTVLRKHKIHVSRDIPEGVRVATQYAFAGGWFEHFWMGHHSNTVYGYDINSAYPRALTELPDLSQGIWEHVTCFEPGAFGVWYVEYSSVFGRGHHGPNPLFCRAENGSISHPSEVSGWYWTPEAQLSPDHVREGWVFREATTSRPFAFVETLYNERQVYKRAGNSVEWAIKLILNSLYGKLAQKIGGKNGKPPSWHQLEWAGYITSFTRAMIYRAIMLNPSAIIAVETDEVLSTEPLDLPLSSKLGEWKRKEYSEIVFLQSGYYYATTYEDAEPGTPPEATNNGKKIICKYRGLDRDGETQQPRGLPYRTVLDNLSNYVRPINRSVPALHGYTTRFVGLGLQLKTNAVWRSWETKDKTIILDGDPWVSKRVHVRSRCPECLAGKSLADCLHPMLPGENDGKSYACKLPWSTIPLEAGCDFDEWVDMVSLPPKLAHLAEEIYPWQ